MEKGGGAGKGAWLFIKLAHEGKGGENAREIFRDAERAEIAFRSSWPLWQGSCPIGYLQANNRLQIRALFGS